MLVVVGLGLVVVVVVKVVLLLVTSGGRRRRLVVMLAELRVQVVEGAREGRRVGGPGGQGLRAGRQEAGPRLALAGAGNELLERRAAGRGAGPGGLWGRKSLLLLLEALLLELLLLGAEGRPEDVVDAEGVVLAGGGRRKLHTCCWLAGWLTCTRPIGGRR